MPVMPPAELMLTYMAASFVLGAVAGALGLALWVALRTADEIERDEREERQPNHQEVLP